MKDVECKRYVASKCDLKEDEKELIKKTYRADLITWSNVCNFLKNIENDCCHLESTTKIDSDSREIVGDGILSSRVGPSKPSEQKDYLHKEGFLIRYKDENKWGFYKFGLVYILEIYGTDSSKLEDFTKRAGLVKKVTQKI
ncbi:MAG: hypothetical protein Q7S27_02545 [Nanoarchaeota archaeon]|nr:hypothetical protein [Nanoarchaeota archaeon]